jgi:integrase
MSAHQTHETVAPGIQDRGAAYVAVAWRGGPSKSFAHGLYGGKRKALAEAKAWRDDVRARRARGESVIVKSTSTVSDECARWLAAHSPYVDDATRHVYATRVRRDVTPFGKRPCADLTRDEVEAWLHALVRDGLGAGSANVSLSIVQRALDAAIDRRALGQNAARRARPVPLPRREVVDAPDRDEVDRIIAALPERYRIVAQLALAAGLRFSEAAGLKPEDVDHVTRTIHVRRQYHQTKADGRAWYVFGPPKSRRERAVPVSASVVMAVRSHVARYGVSTEGTIASTTRGTPLQAQTWQHAWKAATKAAGSAMPGVHQLRHAFGSYLLAAGETIANVSKWMGHASIGITMTTYLHPTPDARPAVDLLAHSGASAHTRRTLPSAREGQ